MRVVVLSICVLFFSVHVDLWNSALVYSMNVVMLRECVWSQVFSWPLCNVMCLACTQVGALWSCTGHMNVSPFDWNQHPHHWAPWTLVLWWADRRVKAGVGAGGQGVLGLVQGLPRFETSFRKKDPTAPCRESSASLTRKRENTPISVRAGKGES